MNEQNLRIAIPNKGRLYEETLKFLEKCGLKVRRENERQYRASMDGIEGGIEVIFQRTRDIPRVVGEGQIDLGITGLDILLEVGRERDCVCVFPDKLEENDRSIPSLPYGYCCLVLAVPEYWVDITSISDLAELAIIRKRENKMLKVATEFPNLTRNYLFHRGVSYFEIIEATGAVESMPSIGSSDFVSCLKSSGTTLVENRLKEIEGGLIINSSACVIAGSSLVKELPESLKLTCVKNFLDRIEGCRMADDFVLITANLVIPSPHHDESRLCEVLFTGISKEELNLLGRKGPTIAKVINPFESEKTVYSISIQVERNHMEKAISILRGKGACDILVTPLNFIFDEKPKAYSFLIQRLKGKI